MKKNGKIIVIAAPSGTGKTTIIKAILKLIPDVVYSISATTREKRYNEVDGKDYFLSTKKLLNKK